MRIPAGSRRAVAAGSIRRQRLILLVAMLLLATGTTLAQPGGSPAGSKLQPDAGYDLSWRLVAGGGGQVQAGGHALGGTAGQAAAGRVQSGGYDLCAGFWCLARAAAGYGVYLPLVYKAP